MRRLWTPVTLSAALAGALLLAAAPASHAEERPAPSFSVRSLDGKTLRLSDYKGKVVVIDFWATWCQPCRASMPHLNDMQDKYAPRGLVVMGLSIDDQSPQQVKRYADKLGVRFRLGMANEAVLEDYGPIRSIPTTFFVNRRGEVARRVVGYIDRETLESYIQELF